jgi:hypothetical protein
MRCEVEFLLGGFVHVHLLHVQARVSSPNVTFDMHNEGALIQNDLQHPNSIDLPRTLPILDGINMLNGVVYDSTHPFYLRVRLV